MNDMAGHNCPPDMTGTATTTTADISAWMSEHPVVSDENMAREAKVMLDRGVLCVHDLEDERKAQVYPLNEQVKKINDRYRHPRELLQRVIDELKSRMDRFIREEETRRFAAAKEANKKAQEAMRAAASAEESRRESIADASAGVLGQGVGNALLHEYKSQLAAKKAMHQAAIAEKETHVKIGGGFRRATSLHEHERLVVENAAELLKDCGLTHDIEEAMLKTARAFKKIHDRYPNGVKAYIERKI